jgi:hypothetical protein
MTGSFSNIHRCYYYILNFSLAPIIYWVIFRKLQADAVDAVPLIRWCIIALSFEDMTQVAATVAADNLRPLHAESTVCMSRDCARDGVIICWPATARLELVIGFVEWRIATSACVDTRIGHMFVVFTCTWSFGAFLSKNSELFCTQKSA